MQEKISTVNLSQNKLNYKSINPKIKINIQNIVKKLMVLSYKVYHGDLEKWARECIWWGRRAERFFVGESA